MACEVTESFVSARAAGAESGVDKEVNAVSDSADGSHSFGSEAAEVSLSFFKRSR
jgi:hypothetical protein